MEVGPGDDAGCGGCGLRVAPNACSRSRKRKRGGCMRSSAVRLTKKQKERWGGCGGAARARKRVTAERLPRYRRPNSRQEVGHLSSAF